MWSSYEITTTDQSGNGVLGSTPEQSQNEYPNSCFFVDSKNHIISDSLSTQLETILEEKNFLAALQRTKTRLRPGSDFPALISAQGERWSSRHADSLTQ